MNNVAFSSDAGCHLASLPAPVDINCKKATAAISFASRSTLKIMCSLYCHQYNVFVILVAICINCPWRLIYCICDARARCSRNGGTFQANTHVNQYLPLAIIAKFHNKAGYLSLGMAIPT